MSPLDVFGPVAPGAVPQLDPARRFEHVLKTTPGGSTNGVLYRRNFTAADHSDSAALADDDARAAGPTNGGGISKKGPIKPGPANAPPKRSDDDRKVDDQPSDQVPSAPSAEAPPPVTTQADNNLPEEGVDQKAVDQKAVVENLELELLPTDEGISGDGGAAAGASMQDGHVGSADSAASEAPSAPEKQGLPIPSVPSANNLLPASDDRAAVDGNGPLSLAETAAIGPVSDSAGTVDPIAAIDAQTAAAELPKKTRRRPREQR